MLSKVESVNTSAASAKFTLYTPREKCYNDLDPLYLVSFWYFLDLLELESSSTKKHGQWSSKNKKGTFPVLILATRRHTTESVGMV